MKRRNGTGAPIRVWRWLLCLAAITTVMMIPPQARSSFPAAPVNTSVRLNSTNIIRGQTGTVTVDLITVGVDENAVGFSIDFDLNELSFVSATAGTSGASLVVNPNLIASGKVGLAASRGVAPAVFAPGTHQIAVITFTAVNTGTLPSTSPTFSDSPIARSLISVAPADLPVDFQTGTVTIPASSPFEADVAPRPTGSATVVVSDWVQVGRFSVTLDTAANGTEFQRADCAPRASFGDGRITVADWVQAGRYSVALDTLSLAGGPTAPTAFTQSSTNLLAPLDRADRDRKTTVRALAGEFKQGLITEVQVELDARGDENALGFTLRFDPRRLQLLEPTIAGRGPTEGRLLVNEKRAADGFVAIALALPTGTTFSRGKHRLVSLRFVQTRGQEAAQTRVWFDDSLIGREVVNAAAEPLQLVTYTPSMPNSEGSALAAARNPGHH